MPESMSRRDFLQVTAGASALGSLGFAPPGSHPAQAPLGAPATDGWFDRPMRWVQLTLVENDPGRFDPKFWLDYFRRLHADAATSERRRHRRVLPDRDAPAPSQRVARRRAIRSARSSPDAARSACASSRAPIRTRSARTSGRRIPTGSPSTATGEPRRHWANPELWVTCALGPYNFDFMDQVHREIVTKYRVDGIFANRWAPQGGDCYCVHCQQNFTRGDGARSAADHRLRRDPARRAFLEWRKARLTELWKHWDATVRAVNPDARFIPNGPPDMKTAGDARRDSVRRLSGAPRRHAAVGERPPRERVPSRSWDDGRSAASSAWASRSRIAGRTPSRASRRSASGSLKAPRTACARG